jgi:hypothetical protein
MGTVALGNHGITIQRQDRSNLISVQVEHPAAAKTLALPY